MHIALRLRRVILNVVSTCTSALHSDFFRHKYVTNPERRRTNWRAAYCLSRAQWPSHIADLLTSPGQEQQLAAVVLPCKRPAAGSCAAAAAAAAAAGAAAVYSAGLMAVRDPHDSNNHSEDGDAATVAAVEAEAAHAAHAPPAKKRRADATTTHSDRHQPQSAPTLNPTLNLSVKRAAKLGSRQAVRLRPRRSGGKATAAAGASRQRAPAGAGDRRIPRGGRGRQAK